ncbi:hypothetical protein ACVWY3_004686 [Bradyrhizobium sp. USDA 4486]
MRKAKVLINRDFTICHTDPWLFGALVEHLGRCIYGGTMNSLAPKLLGSVLNQAKSRRAGLVSSGPTPSSHL